MKIKHLFQQFQRKNITVDIEPLPPVTSVHPVQQPSDIASEMPDTTGEHKGNGLSPRIVKHTFIWPDSCFPRYLRMLDALREVGLPEPIIFQAAYACLQVDGCEMDGLLKDGTAFVENLREQQQCFQSEWEQEWVKYVAVKDLIATDLIKENQVIHEQLRKNEARIRELAVDKERLETELALQRQQYLEKSDGLIALVGRYLDRARYYLPKHVQSA